MTWLADFHEKTDLNKYPVKLRTRGGIGYQLPTGEMVSNFVGHPVHYFDGVWKPITLQKHANGDLEGSDFAFKGGRVTHKGKELFQPKAVIYNGKRYPINLAWQDNRLLCDFPFGTYEVQFREGGVRELLTIPEPVDAVISFDVPHAKNHGLRKKERHLVGTDIFGEEFIITKSMGAVEIDPDYSANTADAMVQGYDATYATARATSYASTTGGTKLQLGQRLFGDYEVYRAFELFDTSGIPDGDAVSQVVMSLYLVTKHGTTAYDIQIKKYDWSAYNPVGAGNQETVYDGALSATLDDNIWKASGSISDGNRYSSGDLATSWVNKTGYTYYALMSSRDSSSTAPSGNEFIEIASQDHATSGNRPYLTVTHAAAAASGGFLMFF